MPVEVLCEGGGWDEATLTAQAGRAATAALTHLGLAPADHEIALLACDDARIAELNATFRDRSGPTNVLSWPAVDLAPDMAGEEPDVSQAEPELGDIAIAWETCQREAVEAGIPDAYHVTHLIVHAVLHLLGYDHIRDEDAALMETLEVRILASLGVPDPYSAQENVPR